MKIQVLRDSTLTQGSDTLVIPVLPATLTNLQIFKAWPDFQQQLTKSLQSQKFKAQPGQTLVIAAPKEWVVENVVLVGLGEVSAATDLRRSLKEAVGTAVTVTKRLGGKTLALSTAIKGFKSDLVTDIVTAALLADYAFETYKQVKKATFLDGLNILVDAKVSLPSVSKLIVKAEQTVAGVTLARNLVNTPAQDMTPNHLAEIAMQLAKDSGGVIKTKILNRTDCAKLNMGAYLAVAQGADNEPKFIHLTYTSPRPTKKTLALVGKGVTFDSGGLSLKPADGMMTMKCDMAGGAAVLGVFATLAALRPRVNIHGLIPATENMPSGKAIRPGDIVQSASGKYIEILNTDAEGRLTLADALHYSLQFKPDAIIDLATLTGACLVALGEEITGLMTNDPSLGKRVLASASHVGEKMWELPLEPRYRDLLLSENADLKNITSSKYGGSVTAGLFLQEFVSNVPWVHLDIAGPAFAERPLASYLGKGGTGHGVLTLVDLIETF